MKKRKPKQPRVQKIEVISLHPGTRFTSDNKVEGFFITPRLNHRALLKMAENNPPPQSWFEESTEAIKRNRR